MQFYETLDLLHQHYVVLSKSKYVCFAHVSLASNVCDVSTIQLRIP